MLTLSDDLDVDWRRGTEVEDLRDELFFRDCFANRAVHFIRQSSGFFDAQAGARAHVQTDLAGVHLREKISSENQGDSDGCAAEGKETSGEKLRPVQRGFESPAVSFAEFLEVTLERLLVSTEETLLLSGVL